MERDLPSPSAHKPPSALAPPSANPTPVTHRSPVAWTSRPEVVDLTTLPPTACPCGTARRAFTDRQDFPATVHWTEIHSEARAHYHRTLTETYVILQCEPDAAIELDGRRVPVRPLMSVLIPPGVRHRAIGEMQVLIFCVPKFDPSDEFFD